MISVFFSFHIFEIGWYKMMYFIQFLFFVVYLMTLSVAQNIGQ
jgi:hypothetical protein